MRLVRILTSLGDLRRLAVTQTPVKDHPLMLMWKTQGINKPSSPGKWDTQNAQGRSDTKRSSNLGHMTWPTDSHKKKTKNLLDSVLYRSGRTIREISSWTVQKNWNIMEHESVKDTNCTVTEGLELRLEDFKIRGRLETI